MVTDETKTCSEPPFRPRFQKLLGARRTRRIDRLGFAGDESDVEQEKESFREIGRAHV